VFFSDGNAMKFRKSLRPFLAGRLFLYDAYDVPAVTDVGFDYSLTHRPNSLGENSGFLGEIAE
jgi:hypothetical protein